MKILAKSPQAQSTNLLVESLQTHFVTQLNSISATHGEAKAFEAVSWERDQGIHGGGIRYEARDTTMFNRGSVNVSQVHYDEDESKKLSSATAISTIIHPKNPHAPSLHMHISWTQMRDGKGYWRMMGDLNPSLKNVSFQNKFEKVLEEVAGEYYEEGVAQGARYFYIPVLERTRGVSHFYLEEFDSTDFEKDYAFAQRIGKAIIDVYMEIFLQALEQNDQYGIEEKSLQLAYHTLYLFQVLTLDRGTTSGLLVHDQNDVGIMGSIPAYIDKNLLVSWVSSMPKPQDKLVEALIEVLPEIHPTPIEVETKKQLAQAVRVHYKQYPKALSMQASGERVPPTVNNHQ